MFGPGRPKGYRNDSTPIWDLMEMADLLEHIEARRVCLTRIGPYQVSTVNLVIDHSFGNGPPVHFETMIMVDVPEDRRAADAAERKKEAKESAEALGMPDPAGMAELLGQERDHDFLDLQWRYSTWAEALLGHERACEHVREQLKVIEAAGQIVNQQKSENGK